VGLVLDEVAVEQTLLRGVLFSPVIIIPPILLFLFSFKAALNRRTNGEACGTCNKSDALSVNGEHQQYKHFFLFVL
jgi:hypothetical protein